MSPANVQANYPNSQRDRRSRPAGNALLDAGLRNAEKGIPVFPLRPGGKEPITAHGFLDASADPAQIPRIRIR